MTVTTRTGDKNDKECEGEECFAVCRRVCNDSCKMLKTSIRPKPSHAKMRRKPVEPPYGMTQAYRVVSVKNDTKKRLYVIKNVLKGIPFGGLKN